MKILLIHNPTSGDGSPSRDDLLGQLRTAGHSVSYASSKSPELDKALNESADIFLVAGGDGTVARVARLLAGRDAMLGIIPAGTANNIARSLNVPDSPDELLARLKDPRTRPLDVCQASGNWGMARFVESAGMGFFADLLDSAESKQDKRTNGSKLGRDEALQLLRQIVLDAKPIHYGITADGRDYSGDYLLVLAMNIPLIGPGVCIAPAADAGDGLLHLVAVTEAQRDQLANYLDAIREAPSGAICTAMPSLRARHIQMDWDIPSGHLDDQPWPDGESSSSAEQAIAERRTVDLEISDPPLRVLY